MQFLLCLLLDVNYKNIFQQIIQTGERLKEPIPSLKIEMRPRKKRVNSKKSILLVKQRNSTGNSAGLRLCQVELRFSSCACVYSQKEMCPIQ